MGLVVYNQEGKISSVNPEGLRAAISGLMAELDPLSQQKYGQTVRDFLTYCADHPGNIAATFSAYLGNLREKGLAASTINGKRVAIRRFCEWAARVGYISQQDFLNVKDVKSIHTSGSRRGSWLTKEQLKCMLEAPDRTTSIGKRDRVILGLLIGCGMRREEITNLKWNQLVQQGNVWILENVERKHGRTQEAIVVPAYVKEILDEYATEKKPDAYILVSYDRHGHVRESLTPQTVWNTVKKYAAGCGFENISPHDIRRSFARNSVDSGLDLAQVQLALGHESITTTQRYVNQIMDYEAIARAAAL